ncbi:hypothetical protein [Pseudohaliea sp.]|uniref:hypothetical protein n=1 Tax=Pseudohaliea sp. TaxID=2740289 RepID=UPI0032ED8D5D
MALFFCALLALPQLFTAEARGQSAAAPACTAAEAVASLGIGGQPDFPPFEVVPAATPVATTLQIDGASHEIFLYPARPVDPATGGRLIAADALSGAVLWDSQRSAAALPAALEHAPALLEDDQGRAYRAYLGDAAGNVWRLDIPRESVAEWRLSLLADLAGLAGGGGTVSFPVGPDLFLGVDGIGRPFDGLVLPVLVETVAGRRIDLLLLRDYALDQGVALEPVRATDLVAARDCESPGCPPDTGPGWHLADAAPGDALAVVPLIDGGRIFLATHARLSLACDDASAERFLVIVDLESALPLFGGDDGDAFALGRRVLDGPRPEGGVVHLQGMDEALAARGVAENVLEARGLAVSRLYWLDLLLDSD